MSSFKQDGWVQLVNIGMLSSASLIGLIKLIRELIYHHKLREKPNFVSLNLVSLAGAKNFVEELRAGKFFLKGTSMPVFVKKENIFQIIEEFYKRGLVVVWTEIEE